MIVAIDGPAGSGKSTIARGVSERLGFSYLDTGAMYRCVALAWLQSGGREGVALGAPAAPLGPLAARVRIEIAGGKVLLDGVDVTERIREADVSNAASEVAADPGVRKELVAKQRALIGDGDWVAEGRDVGTAIAPGAELKVFLTADAPERAHRRAQQLGADVKRILAEQTIRDQRDSTREHSPLTAAADAVQIDTTGMSIEEVVQHIVVLAAEARPI